MSRYIDLISRQAAIDALGEEPEVWTGKDEYAQGLNNQWHYDVNALKALPYAERHGRWEVDDIGYKVVATCSVCHNEIEMPTCLGKPIYSYCPACGAKMVDKDD